MEKFGSIPASGVFIPQTENQMRKNKIAIVKYENPRDSDRAIEEKTVTINFSEVRIERALRKAQADRPPYRERTDRPEGDRGDRGDRGGFRGERRYEPRPD